MGDYDLDNPEHVERLREMYDAAGLGRRRPPGGRVVDHLPEDHRVYLPPPERFEAIDEPDDPGSLAHAFAYARRALQGDPFEGMGGRVLITSTPKAGNPYAPLLEMAPAPDGLDPAVLDWAARWSTSIATLTGEGFMAYERDGLGELQLVGLDADGGLIDASDSLERLRACSRALERRGLAGLGFRLTASHGAPASPGWP